MEVLELQRKLVAQRLSGCIPDTLVLVEHPHVFTVGKGVPGEIPDEINGIPVVRIERGGQWTYHGPGQLVGYPILDLNARKRDIHQFLWNIEQTMILALDEFGIEGGRIDGKGKTGVWVQGKKIVSIGAAVRNWTSFHGFGLNVNTDMNYFTMIEPCGMPSSSVTSMKTLLNKSVDFKIVKDSVSRRFEEVFQIKFKSAENSTIQ